MEKSGHVYTLERDQYLVIDQIRAIANISQHLVLTKKLGFARQVMDVASGSGNSTYEMSLKGREGCYFLGVDTAENTEFALNRYVPCAARKTLDYQAVTSPFLLPQTPKPGGWDIMTAFAFFSWIPLEMHTAVLRHMHALLAYQGMVLIRTQAVQDRPYRRAADAVMQAPEWAPFFVNYTSAYQDQTAEGFAHCLKEAGFADIQVSFHQDPFIFPTKDAMVEYFLQWLPQLSAIQGKDELQTESLQRQFISEVIDAYCVLIGSCGTNISLDFPCILATAKKGNELAWYERHARKV